MARRAAHSRLRPPVAARRWSRAAPPARRVAYFRSRRPVAARCWSRPASPGPARCPLPLAAAHRGPLLVASGSFVQILSICGPLDCGKSARSKRATQIMESRGLADPHKSARSARRGGARWSPGTPSTPGAAPSTISRTCSEVIGWWCGPTAARCATRSTGCGSTRRAGSPTTRRSCST